MLDRRWTSRHSAVDSRATELTRQLFWQIDDLVAAPVREGETEEIESVKFEIADDFGFRESPMTIDYSRLLESARAARLNAFAPYSNFKVGAALLSTDGLIHTGCNVENATYGLTVCAERVALFKAISEGVRSFVAIAIVADTTAPTPPCGACRQLLWEFAGDVEVILGNLSSETGRHRLRDLLPLPFDRRLLT